MRAKEHWLGLLFSIITGLIIIGPNLIFMNSPDYRGLPMMPSDFEEFYVSRIFASYIGCNLNCNPFIEENGSNLPFVDASLVPTILAIPGELFHIDILLLNVIYHFALPLILFLLIYSFILRITGNKLWSNTGTLIILFGFSLLNSYELINISSIIDLFKLHVSEASVLLYARPMYPQFSSIVFFVFLHALLSCYRNPTWKNYSKLGGIFGFTFYIYFYLYSFLSVYMFTFVLISFLSRKSDAGLKSLYAGSLGGLIGLPIMINIFQLINHPLFQFMEPKVVHTHNIPFDIGAITLLLSCILIVLIIIRLRITLTSNMYMFGGLFVSLYLVNLQNVITGIAIQNFHFAWYYTTPIFMIAVITLINSIPNHNSGLKNIAYFFIIVTLLNGILIQKSVYLHSIDYAIKSQDQVMLLQWIKNNTNIRDVIYAPEEIATKIPLFSHAHLMWSPFDLLYLHEPTRKNDYIKLTLNKLEHNNEYNISYVITNKKVDTRSINNMLVFQNQEYKIYKI